MLGIFLDLETNGLNAFKNRVLEIAFQIIDLESGELKASYDAVVAQSQEIWGKSDLNSLKVNGFTFEMCAQGKPEAEIAKEVLEILTKWKIKRGSAVFICQNPSFDRMFFSQLIDPETQEKEAWPYHWLDLASMYWAKEKGSLALSKNAIASKLGLPEESIPHKAMNGVKHLLLCYQAVVGFREPLNV